MSSRDTLIIKNSWSYVITQPDIAGELFYQKLFELNPSLESMFHVDLEQQAKKLIDMITYMVMNLQTMVDIQADIEALAIRHVHYGTEPRHYQTVGKALIWVLENCLGEVWNEETSKAWTDLYTLWANAMIEASKNVSIIKQ